MRIHLFIFFCLSTASSSLITLHGSGLNAKEGRELLIFPSSYAHNSFLKLEIENSSELENVQNQ